MQHIKKGEGAEDSSIKQFIEQLLENKLPLPSDMNLQMQQTHRASIPKPDAKSQRFIVVNFLQFTAKETVLREAWKKKIPYQNDPQKKGI